jgi:uncharacterized membrane protein
LTDGIAEAERATIRAGRPWTTIAALVFLTILAALLRLPFLDHQSLWWDETFTGGIVRQSGIGDVWRQIQATESTPPLYYVLVWLSGARSAAAMRLIPALALVLAVPASYKMARQCASRDIALATAAVVATSPDLVSYSTDARSYGLFVLTAILSAWAFLVLLRGYGHLRGTAWVLASAACVWTHYFGIFIVGAELAVGVCAPPAGHPRLGCCPRCQSPTPNPLGQQPVGRRASTVHRGHLPAVSPHHDGTAVRHGSERSPSMA